MNNDKIANFLRNSATFCSIIGLLMTFYLKYLTDQDNIKLTESLDNATRVRGQLQLTVEENKKIISYQSNKIEELSEKNENMKRELTEKLSYNDNNDNERYIDLKKKLKEGENTLARLNSERNNLEVTILRNTQTHEVQLANLRSENQSLSDKIDDLSNDYALCFNINQEVINDLEFANTSIKTYRDENIRILSDLSQNTQRLAQYLGERFQDEDQNKKQNDIMIKIKAQKIDYALNTLLNETNKLIVPENSVKARMTPMSFQVIKNR